VLATGVGAAPAPGAPGPEPGLVSPAA
jgi:hypothetical protein